MVLLKIYWFDLGKVVLHGETVVILLTYFMNSECSTIRESWENEFDPSLLKKLVVVFLYCIRLSLLISGSAGSCNISFMRLELDDFLDLNFVNLETAVLFIGP